MLKHRPYCAQIRSQGSRRRICPHRLAVPEKIFALLACSIFSTATGAPPRCIRHWRRSAPHPLPLPRGGEGPSGQIAAYSNFGLGSVTSCGALPGQSAARTPTAATPSPSKIAQQIPVLLSQPNPLFMLIPPINPQFCKFSIKKSEILTFQLQKRGDLQGLVKGLFLTGKKFFPVGSLPDQINREPFGPTGQTGAPV